MPFDLDPFAPRLGPPQRKCADLTARARRHEVIEALQNDASLHRTMEWDAEVMPHHEGKKHGARRLGVLGHISGHGG